MDKQQLKQQAAEAALAYLPEEGVIGIGTGSTANSFIEALASRRADIDEAVASSIATAQKLKSVGIPVLELNSVASLAIYVDGTDEINHHLQMIKGGGGALTREKIVSSVAKQFICIADQSKYVKKLGSFPLAIEVVPMARSFVGREIVKLGGDPSYREGFTTDNGNIILDVYNLEVLEPIKLEQALNAIPGIVCHGLFATRSADVLLLATEEGVKTYTD